jgi:tetratricopeptide (TPR) repeat protein
VILTLSSFANNNQKYSTSENDTNRVHLLLNEAANHFYSDLKKTQEYAFNALQIAEDAEFTKGISLANYYLAQVYLYYNFQLAETYLGESLQHAKIIADSTQINIINNSFGILYQNAGEYEKALRYFHRVLKSYLSVGNDSLAAAIYNNIGISYEELNNDSLAISNYQKAIQINQRTGNLVWLARNFQNIGNFYLKKNNPAEAVKYLLQSLEIAEKINDESIKTYLYYNLYEFSVLKNNRKDAMKFARLSLQKSKEQLEINRESEALKAIIELHEKNNRIDSAFIYQKALVTVNDIISKNSRIDQLYARDLQNQLEEQQMDAEMQLKILAIEKSRIELIYIIVILLSVLLLAAAGYSVQWQRKRLRVKHSEHEATKQEKGALENQLDYRNKELTSQVIFLQKRNEYLNKLAEKLTRIADNNHGLVEKQVNSIINDIKKNTETDIWPEFEVRFKETHNAFYKNLTLRYPNLTPNELKLCAFLKLNMSTKEIAELTNQNPDSLKIARYRLRAKLGISREENIVNFLNQI